jgi:hypothetical protein
VPDLLDRQLDAAQFRMVGRNAHPIRRQLRHDGKRIKLILESRPRIEPSGKRLGAPVNPSPRCCSMPAIR